MKKIRIGNDIRISWGITTNGQQESLEEKKLQVQLVVFNDIIDVTSFSVTGNVITFTFLGSQQQYCGTYTLVCRDTTNEKLNTIDQIDAFALVPHTEEESGTDDASVALEVVSLSTDRDSSTIGKAATIKIGSVTTLPSGSKAFVFNSGTVNDAILNFGIPSGIDGEGGLDGIGVTSEPTSVVFNANADGSISSEQDTLIAIKYYRGGIIEGDAIIKSITTTNFKSDIPIESDGSSFYIKGSNICTEDTVDLDGNAVTVPCTQAEVYVVCQIPGSTIQYSTAVRVCVNVQSFYTSLISNQREFKQTFTETLNNVNNTIDGQSGTIDKHYSEFQQTAKQLSSSVTTLREDMNGNSETLSSKISQTASEINSTVASNKTDIEGKLEDAKTEIKQTTDSITSTVASNKTDIEGKVTSVETQITQTAEKVAVVAARFNDDGSLKNTSGLLTTADGTSINSKIVNISGEVISEAKIATMIEDGIAKASIKATQIDFESYVMHFNAGDLTITSDGFNLDKYGNATFTGGVEATSGWLGTKDNYMRVVVDDTDNSVGLISKNSYVAWEGGNTLWNTKNGLRFDKNGSLSVRCCKDEDVSAGTAAETGYLSPGYFEVHGKGGFVIINTSGSTARIQISNLPTSKEDAPFQGLYVEDGFLKVNNY